MSLASRCGFIREIFFLKSAARSQKCHRKQSRHCLHVSELSVANVVVNVVRREESDPRVRRGSERPEFRESDPQEENDPRVRRESELRVRRGSAPRAQQGLNALLSKLQRFQRLQRRRPSPRFRCQQFRRSR